MKRPRLSVFAQALLLACAIAGMSNGAQSRFVVSASATLTPDSSIQRAAGFRLQAKLSPLQGTAQAPPAQTGAGFFLVATASAVATACYNDTIFRDGFDGDGL